MATKPASSAPEPARDPKDALIEDLTAKLSAANAALAKAQQGIPLPADGDAAEREVERVRDAVKLAGANDVTAGVVARAANAFFAVVGRALRGENAEPSVGSAPPGVQPVNPRESKPAPTIARGEAGEFAVAPDGAALLDEKGGPQKPNKHGGADVIVTVVDSAKVGAHLNRTGRVVLKARSQIEGVMPNEVFGLPPAEAYGWVKAGAAELVHADQMKVIQPPR